MRTDLAPAITEEIWMRNITLDWDNDDGMGILG
jgi:hypothetical protein